MNRPIPLLLGCLLVLAACSRQAAPTAAGTANVAAAPTPVKTVVAALGAGTPTLELHGVIGNRDEVRLSFKVGGVIRSIAVDAGAGVRANQLLAEIEPAEIDAQVAQARELDAKAARDLQRGERLYADQVISLEQLQNLRTQRQVAGAQLAAARFNRTHAQILAPADGVILARPADAHELVSAGQPVLVFGSLNRPQVVRAALADRELPQVHLGDAARIGVDALPDQQFSGRVREIAGAADAATGLFPVEIELAAAQPQLAAGMVARVQIAARGGTGKVRVPIGAIVSGDGQRAWLFVAGQGIAHRREVRIAFIDSTEVALDEGVMPGESVVSAGAAYLADGQRIAITP